MSICYSPLPCVRIGSMPETILFEDKLVRITERTIVIGNATIFLANVNSGQHKARCDLT